MSWQPGQLKHWLARNDSGTWGDEPDGVDNVEVLRSTDIALDGSWTIEDPAVRSISSVDRDRKTLELGDLVVVTSSGSEAHLGKTAIVDEEVHRRGACFANFVQRLTPGPNADARYLRYLLSSRRTSEEMANLGNTTTGLRNLNGGVIGAATCPGPPLAEQRAIVDYLDAETARIDALIAKKQQLIYLLEERARLVAEARVSDLRKSVEMVPLKYVVEESDQRLGDHPNPVVLSVSIHRGVVPRSSITDKESRADDLSSYKTCRPGQVVLNRMRAFQGGVGVVDQVGVVSPDYTVLTVGPRLVPAYLHFLMRSDWFVKEMIQRLRGIGSTDQGAVRTPRVNYADLGLICIPVPSLSVQESVALELRRQQSAAMSLAARLRTQLDLLGEHRQALITAAVIGEFAVSGAA